MPVIGFLNSRSPDTSAGHLRAFRQGLQASGYVEGANLAIEYRWAESQIDRLPVLAAELVRRPVAVIAVPGGPDSASAAKAATSKVAEAFFVAITPRRGDRIAKTRSEHGSTLRYCSAAGSRAENDPAR